jgi:hypothetical protein
MSSDSISSKHALAASESLAALVTALPDRATIVLGRRTIAQENPKKIQCMRQSFIG